MLKEKKRKFEEGESSTTVIPKLIGHIKKVGVEEVEDEEKEEARAETVGGREKVRNNVILEWRQLVEKRRRHRDENTCQRR